MFESMQVGFGVVPEVRFAIALLPSLRSSGEESRWLVGQSCSLGVVEKGIVLCCGSKPINHQERKEGKIGGRSEVNRLME